ncbi:hypothetical protein C8J57DRAFT_1494902 [Mycena rebaudengoi]|nr:hypothetical protein C8J57DRAFT_1494902 [Mycena rebaudengoi]
MLRFANLSRIVIESTEVPLDMQAKEIILSEAAAIYRSRLAVEIAETLLHLIRLLQRADEKASSHIEILSRIFVYYGEDLFLNGADPIDAKLSTNDPWKLGHICGYWRNVAVRAQEPWSTFRHECSSGAKLEGEGVELASI